MTDRPTLGLWTKTLGAAALAVSILAIAALAFASAYWLFASASTVCHMLEGR